MASREGEIFDPQGGKKGQGEWKEEKEKETLEYSGLFGLYSVKS